jgi:bis(5'-nucleosyl)-tetraphosphatase (symmetrical)
MPPRHFAVGDLQGCLSPLQALLDRLAFRPQQDRLIVLGDLVNRGPASLQVLRFVRSLGEAAVVLLGNHDLHLLAAARQGKAGKKDSFQDVLDAEDARDLLDWLRHQRLAWRDPLSGTLCVHAGLPREWDGADTLRLAAEVEACLRSETPGSLLDALYGNEPDRWDEALSGVNRLRYIVNALTRQRMQHRDGRLEFRYKGPASGAPPDLCPWFLAEHRRSRGETIAFGHWSTLGQVHWPEADVWGLDSGCVWGGALSALDLGSSVLTQIHCTQQCPPGAD